MAEASEIAMDICGDGVLGEGESFSPMNIVRIQNSVEKCLLRVSIRFFRW